MPGMLKIKDEEMEMVLQQQGDFSAVYANQMELAERCFEFGMSFTERMLRAQIDGGRQLFDLQSRLFGAMEDDAGEAPATQFAAFCSRAMASSAEAAELCLRSASAMQAEATRMVEEFVPLMSRGLTSGMKQATEAVAAAASKTEASRKRAA
jgi:hypothetical protein